jgi:hypothetical protein
VGTGCRNSASCHLKQLYTTELRSKRAEFRSHYPARVASAYHHAINPREPWIIETNSGLAGYLAVESFNKGAPRMTNPSQNNPNQKPGQQNQNPGQNPGQKPGQQQGGGQKPGQQQQDPNRQGQGQNPGHKADR